MACGRHMVEVCNSFTDCADSEGMCELSKYFWLELNIVTKEHTMNFYHMFTILV